MLYNFQNSRVDFYVTYTIFKMYFWVLVISVYDLLIQF